MHMRHSLTLPRLLLAALLASASGLCAGGDKLYTVNSSDDKLREVDPTTLTTVRTMTMVAPGVTINLANGLAVHPLTGELYVLLSIGGTSARLLGKVSTATGTVTPVGSTGQQFANIAFNATGTLYGVTGDGATTPETLYTLSTTTGAPTLVTALGNGDAGESIAFDPITGNLLHASGFTTRVFESVNLSTLTVTSIPFSGDVTSEVLAMTHFAGFNFLLVDINDDLFVITPGGLANMVGTLDHSFVKGIVYMPPPTAAHLNLYGQGYPANGGKIPALWGYGAPAPASTTKLQVFNAPGGAPAVLAIGISNVSLQLSPTCVLQIMPLLAVTISLTLSGSLPGKGMATVSLPVPPGVPPTDLYFQAVVVETATLNLVSTNPIKVHIQ